MPTRVRARTRPKAKKAKPTMTDVRIPYPVGMKNRFRVVSEGRVWVSALNKTEAAGATDGFFLYLGADAWTTSEIYEELRGNQGDGLLRVVSDDDYDEDSDEDSDDAVKTRTSFLADFRHADTDYVFIMREPEWVWSGRRPKLLEGEGDYAL